MIAGGGARLFYGANHREVLFIPYGKIRAGILRVAAGPAFWIVEAVRDPAYDYFVLSVSFYAGIGLSWPVWDLGAGKLGFSIAAAVFPTMSRIPKDTDIIEVPWYVSILTFGLLDVINEIAEIILIYPIVPIVGAVKVEIGIIYRI